MTLGEKIQALRNQHGLSQEQLAEKITVSRQAVSKWELDQSTPDLEYIIQLSEIFGVSIDSLVKQEQDCTSASSAPDNTAETPKREEKGIWRDTVFGKVPFPFVIPVFLVSNLFGLHCGWNWFGKGEPSAAQRFPYPLVVGIVYVLCCVSGLLNWHPGWVLFLTIPVYYLITCALARKQQKSQTKETSI